MSNHYACCSPEYNIILKVNWKKIFKYSYPLFFSILLYIERKTTSLNSQISNVSASQEMKINKFVT